MTKTVTKRDLSGVKCKPCLGYCCIASVFHVRYTRGIKPRRVRHERKKTTKRRCDSIEAHHERECKKRNVSHTHQPIHQIHTSINPSIHTSINHSIKSIKSIHLFTGRNAFFAYPGNVLRVSSFEDISDFPVVSFLIERGAMSVHGVESMFPCSRFPTYSPKASRTCVQSEVVVVMMVV